MIAIQKYTGIQKYSTILSEANISDFYGGNQNIKSFKKFIMNKFARPLGVIVLFSLLSFTTIVETAVWKYDNDHAKLGFSISHMTVTDVDGSFKNVDATISSF